MKTCRTCKWWGVGARWSQRFETDTQKVCRVLDDGLVSDDEVPRKTNNAWIEDGVDSVIVTSPDFGCIHHEEKP